MVKTKTRTRNRAQKTRFLNSAKAGAAFPLDKQRTKNMAATKRKPNRKRKAKRAGGRRRRKNTSARVSAPATQARYQNRKSGKRRSNRRPRKTNTLRRFANAASGGVTGLVIAGAGIIGFDMLTQKFLGPQSGPVAAAVKIGGGYLMTQSGRRIPLIGKHAELIGGVLIVNGVVDLLRAYVLPRVQGYIPAAFLPAPPATNGLGGLVNMPNGFGGLVNIPAGSPLAYA